MLSHLRSYFNISPFAKVEFYRLLCADACSLCGRAVHSPVSHVYTLYEFVCVCVCVCLCVSHIHLLVSVLPSALSPFVFRTYCMYTLYVYL